MKITIKYFATIREHIGCAVEPLETSAQTLAELRQELIAQGGAKADSLALHKAVRVALNHVMADEDTALSEGAEVAFFPPVTGG